MQDQETGSLWSHILGRAMSGPLKGTSLDIIPSVMTDWQSWLKSYPETTVTMLARTARKFRSEIIRNPADFGLGLVHAGKSRFWRFDRLLREPIANDQLAHLKLTVFYDSTSRSASAWNRTIADRVLTFRELAGQVRDTETESSWDVQTGTALEGPLKGTQLEAIPAIISFSDVWKRFHPESTHWQPRD